MSNEQKLQDHLKSEERVTSIDLGVVYAHFEEGDYEGKVTEAYFVDKQIEAHKGRKKEVVKVLRVKVKFEDEEGNIMHLIVDYVVSTSSLSLFIRQLRALKIPFGQGNIDVSKMVDMPVVAEIVNHTNEAGHTYSNIRFLYPVQNEDEV